MPFNLVYHINNYGFYFLTFTILPNKRLATSIYIAGSPDPTCLYKAFTWVSEFSEPFDSNVSWSTTVYLVGVECENYYHKTWLDKLSSDSQSRLPLLWHFQWYQIDVSECCNPQFPNGHLLYGRHDLHTVLTQFWLSFRGASTITRHVKASSPTFIRHFTRHFINLFTKVKVDSLKW